MNANGVGAGFHRQSRAEVERLVSEYKQSGHGRKEFCAAHERVTDPRGRHFAIDRETREQNLSLDELHALLSEMQASGTILPQSVAGKAINYTLKRWGELTHFLDHPIIELSTNWAENSMRPMVIGRKNWLHLGSKEAGPKIAAIFSIVESYCKLGVPIRKYLADMLPGLADRFIHELDGLIPTVYNAKITK